MLKECRSFSTSSALWEQDKDNNTHEKSCDNTLTLRKITIVMAIEIMIIVT